MPVRFILGRAGSGKTHYCLSEMARLLQEKREGPLLFLLPEQATFIHERMLACEYTPHGYAGAEVTSFRRLIWQATRQHTGAPKPPLSEAGRALLMGRILAERHLELRVFGAATLGSGFAKELVNAADELMAYGVEPQRLLQISQERASSRPADPLALKLADIALLYGDYAAAMSAYDNFPDGLGFLARQITEKGFLANAVVFVDGYASFTPRERAVLEALMQHATRLEIALALDPDELQRTLTEQDIFYPCWKSYSQLTEAATRLKVAVEPPLLLDGKAGRFAAHAELAFLERHCYPWSNAAKWDKTPQHLRVVVAADPREELAAAGREIKRLVREEGLRYRNISVITRETAPYQELLPAVFGDLGIPYFVDSPKPLFYHPLAELLRAALEIWAGEAHYRQIFRYLKTGLTPLAAGETDVLENYCLAHGVRHWQWREDKDWQYWRGSEPPELAAERLAEINQLRRRGTAALAAFLRAAPPATAPAQAGELLRALRGLLDDLQVAETMEAWQNEAEEAGQGEQAALHRQALAKLEGFLQEAAQLLEGCQLSAQQLLGMLDAGCAALTLSLIPPGLDQVLVAGLERSRNPELKAAIVLGLNADILPKKVQPEALFAEHERQELQTAGLELAPNALTRQTAEHYLAYIALTRSGGNLLLTYALADNGGQSLLPSPLIKRLRSLFPELKPQRYEQAGKPAELSGGADTLAALTRQLASWRKGQPVPAFWQDVYNWYAADKAWQGPLQRMLQGLSFAPAPERLSRRTLERLYGSTLKSSVSRLEKFRACPFAYFAAYGLKLKERPVYELTPLERGDIFHQALAELAALIKERGLNYANLDEEQATALVDEVLNKLAPGFLSGILAATARYRYLAARIRHTLIATLLLLAEHMRRGQFVPVAWELPFGTGDESALPALTIELGEGKKLEIQGRIDRVDMARGQAAAFFRVVDYKTGSVSLSVEDILSGLRLQLIVYLLVLLDNGPYFATDEAKAAGLYYMPVRDEYLAVAMPPVTEAAVPVGLKLRGLSVKDAEAVRLADAEINGHSKLIPAALSANGFYSNSPGLAPEQMAGLRQHVLDLLRDTAGQMLSGAIETSPLRSAKFDACSYCDYSHVCGFEGALAAPRKPEGGAAHGL